MSSGRSRIFPCALLAGTLLAACASTQRPVLYPNETLKRIGEQAAQREVDDCIALAERSGAGAGTSQVVKRGAEGAAVGGAAGAAGGAVRGRGGVGEAAAVGAAAGAAAGAVHGAFHDKPSEIHRKFVRRCLSERGLEVIGWQ
jgi:hypothetical protein